MSAPLNPQFRNGMNVVFVPPKPQAVLANVVFVHGLFGHPWKTWAEDGAKTPRKPFWPLDLLPAAVKNVCVYSFGYDADIERFMAPAGTNSLQDHGANLLNDLVSIRRDQQSTGDRAPFIFIVHSLGGLVLKEALNQSSDAPQALQDHRSIIESTHGVIFLGTPHRGSDVASYGKVAFSLARVFAARRPNTQLLRALERGNEALERVAKKFYQTWDLHKSIRVYSFHEEKDISRMGVFRIRVVSPECARIGHANEVLGSIPADHRAMAKFSSESDTGFVRIRNALFGWVAEIRAHIENISNKDYQDCLESLNQPEARERIRQVSLHHADSFEWLFTEDVPFTRWLADDTGEFSPLFWITGKPGSGKSTLMRFAMRDPRLLGLLPEGLGVPIGYFFHMRGQNTVQKSLRGMLQELVYQLLKQFPSFLAIVKPNYEVLLQESRAEMPEWDIDSLSSCLSYLPSVISASTTRLRFVLFIDALDENERAEQNARLAHILKQLSLLFGGGRHLLKICLASRPWPLFQAEFGSDPRIPHFAIHNFTRGDIASFTTHHLESAFAPIEQSSSVHLVQGLVQTIVEKAHGVFIWVRIVVESLEQCVIDGGSFTDVEDYLQELPDELNLLYQHTMARISPEYALETLVVCRIMSCSRAEFTLAELYNVTKYCINGHGSVTSITFDTLGWLKSRTGGLLEVIMTNAPSAPPGDRPSSLSTRLRESSSAEA